jgi:hypothetical protein
MHNVHRVVPFIFSYSIVSRIARDTILAARRPISSAGTGGAALASDLVREGGLPGPRWPLIRAQVAVIRFSVYRFGRGILPVDVKSVRVGLMEGV